MVTVAATTLLVLRILAPQLVEYTRRQLLVDPLVRQVPDVLRPLHGHGVVLPSHEQAVPALNPGLLTTDRFYWQRRLRPKPDQVEDWRSVNLAFSKKTNLLPLYEAMKSR